MSEMNLRGLDLSEGDKIRNFILMGLPSKEQNGFDDSGIRMNTWIAKKDKWTHTSTQSKLSDLESR